MDRSLAVLICVLMVAVGSWARPAHAIGEGHLADTCQYPSVVRLVGSRQPVELCTGAYVGGRVILTAAHCFDRFGYQMDRLVFEAETGATAILCDSDADCPTKMLMGQPTQLLCATEGANVNAEPGECYNPDLELSNYFLHPPVLHVLVGSYLLRLTEPGTDFNGSTTPRVLRLSGAGVPVEIELVRHSEDEVAGWWQRVVWV